MTIILFQPMTVVPGVIIGLHVLHRNVKDVHLVNTIFVSDVIWFICIRYHFVRDDISICSIFLYVAESFCIFLPDLILAPNGFCLFLFILARYPVCFPFVPAIYLLFFTRYHFQFVSDIFSIFVSRFH